LKKEFRLNSNKLAPFRRYTPPYTGSSKYGGKLSEILQIFNSNVARFYRYLNELIMNRFNIFDVSYFNQFVRGEIYNMIDLLMSCEKKIEENDLKGIIEFFELYISFTVKYLDVISPLLKEVLLCLNDSHFFVFIIV
jgi:hypothetical protein